MSRLNIVPSVLVQSIIHYGIPQNETHLTLGHAGLEFVNHTLTDNVPLLYGNPVYSGETYGGTAALYCQND